MFTPDAVDCFVATSLIAERKSEILSSRWRSAYLDHVRNFNQLFQPSPIQIRSILEVTAHRGHRVGPEVAITSDSELILFDGNTTPNKTRFISQHEVYSLHWTVDYRMFTWRDISERIRRRRRRPSFANAFSGLTGTSQFVSVSQLSSSFFKYFSSEVDGPKPCVFIQIRIVDRPLGSIASLVLFMPVGLNQSKWQKNALAIQIKIEFVYSLVCWRSENSRCNVQSQVTMCSRRAHRSRRQIMMGCFVFRWTVALLFLIVEFTLKTHGVDETRFHGHIDSMTHRTNEWRSIS